MRSSADTTDARRRWTPATSMRKTDSLWKSESPAERSSRTSACERSASSANADTERKPGCSDDDVRAALRPTSSLSLTRSPSRIACSARKALARLVMTLPRAPSWPRGANPPAQLFGLDLINPDVGGATLRLTRKFGPSEL